MLNNLESIRRFSKSFQHKSTLAVPGKILNIMAVLVTTTYIDLT